MVFKEERLKEEFFKAHPMVRLFSIHFEQLCIAHFNKDPVCTRIFEYVKGATGIHSTGRAIDFRNEHAGKWMFSKEEARFLVSEMNRKFPGNDKYATCLHHSFNGGPHHFHIQLSAKDDYDTDLDCFVVL